MPSRWRNIAGVVIVTCVFAAASCRQESPSSKPTSAAVEVKTELTFPESLRVTDESVNNFVRAALTQCASGDYEAFRGLWTAKQEPIARAEFNEGWHAVNRIEVRALEKVLLATGEDAKATQPVYVLAARVELDPAARVGKREPVREIVLMLVRENDQWRLAAAPKDMRDWVKKKLDSPPEDSTRPDAGQTTGNSP